MINLKDILTIIFSSLIGASSSMIITILAGRRFTNPIFNVLYSLKVHALIIVCLILFLWILSYIKD